MSGIASLSFVEAVCIMQGLCQEMEVIMTETAKASFSKQRAYQQQVSELVRCLPCATVEKVYTASLTVALLHRRL